MEKIFEKLEIEIFHFFFFFLWNFERSSKEGCYFGYSFVLPLFLHCFLNNDFLKIRVWISSLKYFEDWLFSLFIQRYQSVLKLFILVGKNCFQRYLDILRHLFWIFILVVCFFVHSIFAFRKIN